MNSINCITSGLSISLFSNSVNFWPRSLPWLCTYTARKACWIDHIALGEKPRRLIPKIDLTDINKPSKEIACYYGFCSLYLLKHDTKLKHDINKYIELYIDEIITINEIQLKIDDLLNNPDKEFTPEELRVHDN